jgi:serine/threonine protein kinase
MMSTAPPEPDKPAPAAIMAEQEALPPGTRFGELEVVRVLGVGGFGIVYLARDHALEREVALKEYMPASLATRGQGPQITVRSGRSPRPTRPACARSSTRRGCWRSSTTRRWSRSTGSGRTTPPPTW